MGIRRANRVPGILNVTESVKRSFGAAVSAWDCSIASYPKVAGSSPASSCFNFYLFFFDRGAMISKLHDGIIHSMENYCVELSIFFLFLLIGRG